MFMRCLGRLFDRIPAGQPLAAPARSFLEDKLMYRSLYRFRTSPPPDNEPIGSVRGCQQRHALSRTENNVDASAGLLKRLICPAGKDHAELFSGLYTQNVRNHRRRHSRWGDPHAPVSADSFRSGCVHTKNVCLTPFLTGLSAFERRL